MEPPIVRADPHQALLTLANRGVLLGLLITSSIPARCFWPIWLVSVDDFSLVAAVLRLMVMYSAQDHAGVIRDSAGNLYGTTNGGGKKNYGVIFKLKGAAAAN